ncbi:hypothetical protein ACQPZK_18800 [Micromonospora sp. CA-249363]|uniref:hypothetical protein n=1 Tax=Micromonospora sp. CA-249363 TaxID=3239963 RepID=UPI003D912504
MRAQVGLLTIGRVDDAERSEVARHLTECPSCRSERDDIARVVGMLEVLRSASDIAPYDPLASPAVTPPRPPAQLFGAPGTPSPRTTTAPLRPALESGGLSRPARDPVGHPAPVIVTPLRTDPPGRPASPPGASERLAPWPIETSRPMSRLPAPRQPAFAPALPYAPVAAIASRPDGYLPPRPTTGPLSRGPHSHRRPRRRSARFPVSLVLLTVTLTAGAVLAPWPPADGRAPVVATAASGDTAQVDLRAVLRGGGDSVRAELTVAGLAPGATYQVYVGTVHGDLELLGELPGVAGPADWSGVATVPIDDLAYLSVWEVGGQVVAAANVVKDPGRVV